MNKAKITATIRISRPQIFNEVSKLTSYMGAKETDAETDVYDRIFLSDAEQELLEKTFLLVHSECVDMLYPYTKDEMFPDTENEADGDAMTEDENNIVYDITLSLPMFFSRTTIRLVENLIQEYFVSRLMSEWVLMTAPEKHPYWTERYAVTKNRISIALTARTRPLRRILRPF